MRKGKWFLGMELKFGCLVHVCVFSMAWILLHKHFRITSPTCLPSFQNW
jgi:hypothetical protein